ncbi:MAG: ABC transporter ATP-binding protein [Anaerolineaceae bacterium]|nr:ABC transporter ATP-binding protein [Anaerolineaceae bacterium]
MDEIVIETNELIKQYGSKTAVRDLSLRIDRGEVFGFLGPNGAGKTTSIKMLLNLITPTSGKIRIFGSKPGNHHVRSRIGFLPEHFHFQDWLTGEEFLRFHGQLYGLNGSALERRILELLDRVNLLADRQKKLHTYSKGMLQRIGLVQSLINNPELVFLDEPTSGLDPVGRILVRDIIADLRKKGVTIFLNSHFLSEVEITCDRVAFIDQGKIIKRGSLKDLLKEKSNLYIRLDRINSEILKGLENFGKRITTDDISIQMIVDDEELLPEINRFLLSKGSNVYEISFKTPSLEDLFISLIENHGDNP